MSDPAMVMNRPDQIPPATELFQNCGAAVIINIPSSKVRVPMVVIAIPMEKRKNYLTTVNYTYYFFEIINSLTLKKKHALYNYKV